MAQLVDSAKIIRHTLSLHLNPAYKELTVNYLLGLAGCDLLCVSIHTAET